MISGMFGFFHRATLRMMLHSRLSGSFWKKNAVGFVLLAGATCFYFPSLYAASKGIQLDSPKVRLIVAPGKTKTGRIEVKNPSGEPKKVQIFMEDWQYTDQTGLKKFAPPGTTDLSCAKWITYAPGEFTVPAKGKQYVNYTVTVPDDAKGGHYAVLFFEFTMVPAPEKTTAMVSMPLMMRIGSLFYVEPEGTINRTGVLKDLSLKKESPDKPWNLSVEYDNTGNVDVIASGNYNIIDKKGMVFARGTWSTIFCGPGGTGQLTSTMKGTLPQGTYDVVVALDIGQALEELSMGRGPMIVKEAEIQIDEKGQVLKIGELK